MAMRNYAPLQFVGNKQKKNITVTRNGASEALDNYIPDDDLVRAVNLALLLEKPLLVMGEPGCGKSLLAKAVAYDLYKNNMYSYYKEWHIKSTSKAKEGLYEFDYVHRLRDATLPGQQAGDIQNVDKYIHFGAMGEAFILSTAPDKRAVLLIDEIDKADIDFPNDLLNELDRMEFTIQEKKIEQKEQAAAGKKTTAKNGLPADVKAAYRPVVIITSNSEKELPDAFLRRCIFHYIQPLTDAKLKEIVVGRYYDKAKEEPLIDDAIKLFVNLRETIKNELLSIGKNISTSEFINWFEALKYYHDLAKTTSKNKTEPLAGMLQEAGKLTAGSLASLPFKNILLKNINSVIRFNDAQPQR